MPYSLEKQIQHKLKKKYNKILKQMKEEHEDNIRTYKKESDTIWEKSINATYEELYDEAVNMYDALIEDYYKYKTKSYYRHHVGVGTGTGENLYFGKQIELTRGMIPEISIDFSGQDMDGYKHNSADEVLEMVMSGIRGVPSKGWWATWEGSYDGKYFSVGGVDITTAFILFNSYFDDLSRDIFREKVNEEKKTGKYRFYR